MREIVLDTETTGLDIAQGHRIVEIGAVELYNKRITGREFHAYVKPNVEVSQEAYQVHGISTEFLQDKPTFDHISERFLAFISGATLVIHNAPFDIRFLNHEFSLINAPSLELTKVVDTLVIARREFPGQRASLDALCRKFNVDSSMRDFHGALLDAKLLAQVYIALTRSVQQFAFNLEDQFAVGDRDDRRYQAAHNLRVKATIPDSEEFTKHRAFLERLTNPLWRR